MSRHRTVTGQLALPNNWKWVPLGDILTNIIGGGTPSKCNPSYWQGKIPWLTIKDMRTRRPIDAIDHISETAVKESATNIIPADTVIIATRVGLGKVIRVPYDATINQDLKALIPKEGIDKSYLEYWVVSIADYLESIGSGTTVKGIRLETLREIPFPLAPTEDQKRIVAEIEKQFSRLDEAVASLKRIQSNLKRYKAAVLKAAVEGKLTEQWRKDHPAVELADQLLKRILAERRAKWEAEELAKMKAKGTKPKDDSWKKKYKKPAGPDTANLPELPKGWIWTSTGELCDCIVPNRDKPKTFSGVIPWITLPDFNDNSINIYRSKSEMGLSKEETSKFNARIIPKGSVVMSCVGRFGIVGIAQSDIVINQQLHGFLMPTEIVKEYFAYAIKTQVPYMNAISTATTIAYLNKENCNSVPIALPSHREQKEIHAEIDRRLSVTEELEATIETSLKRAERLRQTILQKVFSGELITQRA